MTIMANGLGLDGSALIPAMPNEEFGRLIFDGLARNIERLRNQTESTTLSTTFRGEIERTRSPDLHDPRVAGWTFLVNDAAPGIAERIDAIRPLAVHRGMSDPAAPLRFRNEPPEEWTEWLNTNYFSADTKAMPRYVLIVGGPAEVPFQFQSLFDSAASVGRVDFNTIQELSSYVEKVIRLETAAQPSTTRTALFFATDEGPTDPTHYSRQYMAAPLANRVAERFGLGVTTLTGEQATKSSLASALRGSAPALVYTASHGLGARAKTLEFQRRYNGAICCHQNGEFTLDDLFGGDDVPSDGPFLEGAVFFQFACFGYGTPSESDFGHWSNGPLTNSTEDFVASLPKRLLAQPRGPIAFVGHVDLAWMHGFTDQDAPDIAQAYHPRLEPFVHAIDTLLDVLPVGEGMTLMNKRYDLGNAQLALTWDRLQKGTLQMTNDYYKRLADTFIARSDAQNYMVFGDPAAALRISA